MREREGERKGVRVIMYCHTHAQTLRIPVGSTIEDVVRMYFKVETDLHLQWTLVEMSLDETGTIEKNKSLFCWPYYSLCSFISLSSKAIGSF